MNRRSLLAALGAGVAAPGLLVAPASSASGTAPRTADAHRIDVPGSPVAALALGPVPDGTPLQHAVTVHGQPAPGEPVRLTVSVENTDDRPHTLYAAARTRPDHGDTPATADAPAVADRATLQPGERLTRTLSLDVRSSSRDSHPFVSRFVVDRGGESVAYRWGFAVEME